MPITITPNRQDVATREWPKTVESLCEAIVELYENRELLLDSLERYELDGAHPVLIEGAHFEIDLIDKTFALIEKSAPWTQLNHFKTRANDLMLHRAAEAIAQELLVRFVPLATTQAAFKKMIASPSDELRGVADDITKRFATLFTKGSLLDALARPVPVSLLFKGSGAAAYRHSTGPKRAAQLVVAELTGVSESLVRKATQNVIKQRDLSTRRKMRKRPKKGSSTRATKTPKS